MTLVKKLFVLLKFLPGVLFLFFIGLLAKYVGSLIPYVSYLIVAILFGIVSSNLFTFPPLLELGITETHKVWLKTGIVILGARVLLGNLLQVGPILLGMILVFIILALVGVELLSSRFKLDKRLGSCLAAGTSVCGVSAIIAAGGAIRVKKSYLACAIATILIFDVITVFVYPLIGGIFSIPSAVYGPWTGISMFSTGTTVAAGFSHSDFSGQLATIAKMARNVFIGIWALVYSFYYVKRTPTAGEEVENKLHYLWEKFPKSVVGFAITMLVANMGFLAPEQIDYMQNAYSWLFMMAFVGLGYEIKISDLKDVGLKSFLVVLIVFLGISISSLGASYFFFG